MQCNLIDTSFYFSHNLTGCAVCILITGKKKGKISMPEIPLKSMTY